MRLSENEGICPHTTSACVCVCVCVFSVFPFIYFPFPFYLRYKAPNYEGSFKEERSITRKRRSLKRCQGVARTPGHMHHCSGCALHRQLGQKGSWEPILAHTLLTKPCALALAAPPYSPRGQPSFPNSHKSTTGWYNFSPEGL